MAATVLDGRELSGQIESELKQRVAARQVRHRRANPRPGHDSGWKRPGVGHLRANEGKRLQTGGHGFIEGAVARRKPQRTNSLPRSISLTPILAYTESSSNTRFPPISTSGRASTGYRPGRTWTA